MPWYESKPVSGKWGWHWTMNHFDPDRIVDGKREAASRFRPLIGLYDSGDPQAVECQVLLMKLAGLDGVLADWYGDVPTNDYAAIDRNTALLFRTAARAGLKFALVYEDQTVPQLVKNGAFPASEAVAQGRALFARTARRWFASPNYLKLDGRPLLLVFGPQYYKTEDWPRLFAGLPKPPFFSTLHTKKGAADGTYDWPLPKEGDAARARFAAANPGMRRAIPVAYPRFVDIYKEAGVGESYGTIPDDGGATYRRTLADALASGARLVQIATWNDWGEGTGIEPTAEYAYRDLEITQRLHHARFTPEDLRLPVRLYRLQKSRPQEAKRLAEVSRLLFAGDVVRARVRLNRLDPRANGDSPSSPAKLQAR